VFERTLPIPKDGLDQWLEAIPSGPAVFCLFSGDGGGEPYISKSANLRRRLRRLLAPAAAAGKRLHLGGRVSTLAYFEAASPFAASFLLLKVNRRYFGALARKRLHLRPPALVRFAAENPYPRAFVTHRISRRALDTTYGPFSSRAEAERFLDDSLNLFQVRRCIENLNPDPAFPGCVYSEMKMCLAPCFRGCTDERYGQEANRVREYLATRGAAEIAQLEREREERSEALDFEAAGRLHARIEAVKAIAQRVAPLVHPLGNLDAAIVQPAPNARETGLVALYLVRSGKIFGPGFYSVAGMRHPNEKSGSSSLFAQPVQIEPIPFSDSPASTPSSQNPSSSAAGEAVPPPATIPLARGELERRLIAVLDDLESEARDASVNVEELSEHLSLLARWYYRPPARRFGEIFFREEGFGKEREGSFSFARILRGISRVFCDQQELAAPVPITAASAQEARA
jgi:excinuclease UvrABC nuclease subunit